MASSYKRHDDNGANTVDFGVIGTMDPIPAGYSTSFVAYVGSHGINDAFERWGSTLLHTYDKTSQYFESDYVLNYLGYVSIPCACHGIVRILTRV